MDDALLERVVERAAALVADLQDVGDRQQMRRVHVLRQVAARHEVHRDVAGVLLHHRV